MKSPIPDEIWSQHVAILAKPGRGKSVTAKGGAAHLMSRGLRVGAIDPAAAWWGMRLKADGKTPAFPMVIFGGDHGDIEIFHRGSESGAREAGERIGRLCASSDWSWIVDTSKFTKEIRTHFFIGLGEALFAGTSRRINLFIDECHLFIPQQSSPGKAARHMLDVGNNLIAGGRGRGFCVTMISQRPAKVHKDSLTATEAMITLGMIAPHDLRAVRDWIEVQGDIETSREMIKSLPGLPVGEGWIYAPTLEVLKRVKFPMIETFDCSAAPSSAGRQRGTVELKEIDIDAIRAELTPKRAQPAKSVENRQKAPQGRALASISAPAPALVRDQLKAAREAGIAAGRAQENVVWGKRLAAQTAQLGKLKTAAQTVVDGLASALATLAHMRYEAERAPQVVTAQPILSWHGKNAIAKIEGREPPPRPRQPIDYNRLRPEDKILDALAFWATIGNDTPSRNQVITVAGYSLTASTGGVVLGKLKSEGMIDYPDRGTVRLTPQGMEVAVSLSRDQAKTRVESLLSGPELKMFGILAGRPDMSREDLITACGYSLSASTGGVILGRLKALDLVRYPSRGIVTTTDWAGKLFA